MPFFLCLLLQLGCRLAHILRRIMPISMYLLQKDGQCLSGHDLLLRRISSSFQDFIEEVRRAAVCMARSFMYICRWLCNLLRCISSSFQDFIEEVRMAAVCMARSCGV
jgi:hypothetical protein